MQVIIVTVGVVTTGRYSTRLLYLVFIRTKVSVTLPIRGGEHSIEPPTAVDLIIGSLDLGGVLCHNYQFILICRFFTFVYIGEPWFTHEVVEE